MKNLFCCLLLLLAFASLSAQDEKKANELVAKGITLHDKGDFKGAIALYEKSLEADKDNLPALAEMAISYFSLQKYDEVVRLSRMAIEKHPKDENLESVFVIYGSALDMQDKKHTSVEVYDEGIAMFPKAHMLYFNKGVTLINLKKPKEAMQAFQESATVYPRHPGTQHAIAVCYAAEEQRIPALLAYFRFLILEPSTQRSVTDLAAVNSLLTQGVQQGGKKGDITLSVDSGMLGDTLPNGEPNPNSFQMIDLMLTLTGGLDFDKKFKNETPRERLSRKASLIFSSLSEAKEKGTNFAWRYYVPYFAELNKADQLETFSYIVMASSDDGDVKKWLKANEERVDAFYKWSAQFPWLD